MIAATKIYEFDEFRVDTIQRRLTRSGEIVPLHSKAFDLLLVLVKNAGQDVSKDELLEAVWPNQILEESNLAVNISAIRRALGETAARPRFIVTIPGLGYRFVAHVREASSQMMGVVIERETFAQVSVEMEGNDGQNGLTEPAVAQLKPATMTSLSTLSRIGIALTAVVMMVLAAVSFAWWRHTRAHDPASRFTHTSYKQLTNNGIVYNAALSRDGKLFAFVMVQKEKESLRVGQTNGVEQIELRAPAEVSYSGLVFSHDGSSLFYSFADRNAEKFDFYKLPALGGIPVKLRDNVGPFFAVSPDDKRVAFVRQDPEKGTSSILVSDFDGLNEATVVTLPAMRVISRRSLDWSPDGSMLSFGANDGLNDSHFHLYMTRLANLQTTSLSALQWRQIDATGWLKDGSGLTVIALLVRLQQINHIWVMPADDLTKARQITFGTIGSSDGLLGLDWTPNGQLVYASFSGRGQSLWTINADGTNARQITAPEYEDQMPSVTADGRTIVFESNRSGGNDIWRADIDGSNATQLTNCHENFQPSVSPDGKWVVYESSCDGTGSLWRVPLRGGEPQRVSDKPFSWPSVSPDGNWIACGLMLSPPKARLAIVPMDGSQPPMYFDAAPLGNLRLGIRWSNDGKSIIYRDQRVGLWRQSLNGGAPTKVQGLPPEKIYGFGWSRDNKLFAYTLGAEIRDVVLVSTAK